MKKAVWLSLVMLLLSVVMLTSCVSGKARMPVDPYNRTPPATSTPAAPSLVTGPAAMYLSNTGFDPAAARFFTEVREALGLTDSELDLLRQNGFVMTDRLAWDRFLDAYAWIYWKDLPVLITTDSILHSVHQSYDDILIDIELNYLKPRLKSLLEMTKLQLISAQGAGTAGELSPLYRDVSTYLEVALSLLEGRAPDGPAKDMYQLAVQSSAFQQVDLFGSFRKIDFTLFKPRGHYTKSPELEQYFRSMNWLAQIDFRFVEFDPLTSQPVFNRSQVAAAGILRNALDSAGQREDWNAMDSLLKVLVGESDNITLPGFDAFMADMNLTGPEAISVADERAMLDRLLNNDYGNQRITGQLICRSPQNFSPEPVPRPVSFMLMGQRFAIDSYVMGNLVYDRMMKNGKPVLRPLPSSLDVMYTLGNNRALTHLTGEVEKYGYAEHLGAMRQEVDSLPPEFWDSPVYNRWLGMLRRLNRPTTDEKYPQALRTAAWADKMLQTQLGSWAQLRHDNVLYVKQSFTSGIACEYPEGYVEPYPEFYSALYDYARAGFDAVSAISTSGERRLDYIKSNVLTYYTDVMSAAEQLKTLAEKELSLQEFTPEEKDFLKSVVVRRDNENRVCGGPAYVWDGWYVKMFYREDDNPALIADVHTNPDDDGPLAPTRVLHAATGPALPICLAAETDEGATLYVGPAFSYYDVIEEGYPPRRLTDEDWRSRLKSGGIPDHPGWTSSFLVPSGKMPEALRLPN